MALPLKPRRGGFLRPFGCGQFIRDYLLGYGPYGSPGIDPVIGAPQADIFRHYKTALIRATAEDRATRYEEKQAHRENRSINPAHIERLIETLLTRSPYKASGCRFHSFVVYFSNLQRLGWVEFSGTEEPSAFQDHYPSGLPRRYFRLSAAGRAAPATAWSNPLFTLYG